MTVFSKTRDTSYACFPINQGIAGDAVRLSKERFTKWKCKKKVISIIAVKVSISLDNMKHISHNTIINVPNTLENKDIGK